MPQILANPQPETERGAAQKLHETSTITLKSFFILDPRISKRIVTMGQTHPLGHSSSHEVLRPNDKDSSCRRVAVNFALCISAMIKG